MKPIHYTPLFKLTDAGPESPATTAFLCAPERPLERPDVSIQVRLRRDGIRRLLLRFPALRMLRCACPEPPLRNELPRRKIRRRTQAFAKLPLWRVCKQSLFRQKEQRNARREHFPVRDPCRRAAQQILFRKSPGRASGKRPGEIAKAPAKHKKAPGESLGAFVRVAGLEPATYWFVASCAIQLRHIRIGVSQI